MTIQKNPDKSCFWIFMHNYIVYMSLYVLAAPAAYLNLFEKLRIEVLDVMWVWGETQLLDIYSEL